MAHARRKIVELHLANNSTLVAAAIEFMGHFSLWPAKIVARTLERAPTAGKSNTRESYAFGQDRSPLCFEASNLCECRRGEGGACECAGNCPGS